MLRYGIVGCGGISRFHFHALKEMGATITCVADINLEAAQKRAKEKEKAKKQQKPASRRAIRGKVLS